MFVERAASHGGTGAEDDGYLVGFVHEKDVVLAYNIALVRHHREQGSAY